MDTKHFALIMIAIFGLWLIFWEPVDYVTSHLETWQSIILGVGIVAGAFYIFRVKVI